MRWLLTSVLLVVAATPLVPVQGSDIADEAALQQALSPFQGLLEGLPTELRERLVRHGRAWVALSSEQQAELREQLLEWDDLAPQEKLALRERFESWTHMDEATRGAALDAARRYAQLPEAIRQSLRDEFDALDSKARQRYLFDASTRTAVDLADALFRFVPAEQHSDTLAMLRELNEAQVMQLRRKLTRLPPTQRDAYRQRLLELDAAGRAEMLNDDG